MQVLEYGLLGQIFCQWTLPNSSIILTRRASGTADITASESEALLCEFFPARYTLEAHSSQRATKVTPPCLGASQT
jgi:hypothetical protein